MIKEVFETEGINYITCRSEGQPEYLLIQAVDDHDIEVLESEFCKIAEGVSSPVLLAAFKVRDWNEDLSPWQAPPVFGNVPFGGKAGETLNFVKGQFIPCLKERYGLGDEVPVIIGGYSLAGLFALWTALEKSGFAAAAAASPSVWFPGWAEYVTERAKEGIKTPAVYLSLGDKEDRTRNQVMKKVRENLELTKDILSGSGVSCEAEYNPGNHFRDPDLRTARAFIWCILEQEAKDE